MRKVALVTGGAVRLGRAVTLGLAEAGYDLMIHYHSSEGPARETAREVEALGRRACTVRADLAGGAGVGRVVDAVSRAYGRLDLLVNGAASFEQADLLDVDEEAWDRVMATNLKGPFLLVRAAASLLRDSRGSIVNMVDLSAFQPWIRYPHHGVSKAGLMHLTRVLARVMAPHVRVNAIAPGTILLPDGATEAKRQWATENSLLKRVGTPEDVARTIIFMTETDFVTGAVYFVDGGRALV